MDIYNILRYMFAGLHLFAGIGVGGFLLKNRDETDGLDFTAGIIIVLLCYVGMGVGYLIVDYSYKLFVLCFIDVCIGLSAFLEAKKTKQKLCAALFMIFPIVILSLH